MRDNARYQHALALDEALSAAHDQPMRLNARDVVDGSVVWQKVRWGMLKKERERRAFAIKERDVVIQQRDRHISQLDAKIKDLEEELTRVKSFVNQLRFAKTPSKFLEYEGLKVRGAWREAQKHAQSAKSQSDLDGACTYESWQEPLEIHKVIADIFEQMLSDPRAPEGLHTTAGRQGFLRALGKIGSKDTIVALLRSVPLLEPLSTKLRDAIHEYTEQCDLLAE